MFLDFYNLREQPFAVTPDPRFLYLGASHGEAIATLIYAVECERGFTSLIATPGMGKTTLLFSLLNRFRDSSRTAFLFHTKCNSAEFLRQLVSDLDVECDSRDPVEMRQRLNHMLVQEAQNGRRVLVVIDEAQDLDDEVLESIRLLSNFETAERKLIHFLLAGQPALAKQLARPSMAQLRQRISSIARIEPLTPGETNLYIEHRLAVAGYQGNSIFDAEARALIAAISGGIPRNINNICFHALSLGFATHKRVIDGSMIREIAADLDLAGLCADRTSSLPPALDREPLPRTAPCVGAAPVVAPAHSGGRSASDVPTALGLAVGVCSLLLLAWISSGSGFQTRQKNARANPDLASQISLVAPGSVESADDEFSQQSSQRRPVAGGDEQSSVGQANARSRYASFFSSHLRARSAVRSRFTSASNKPIVQLKRSTPGGTRWPAPSLFEASRFVFPAAGSMDGNAAADLELPSNTSRNSPNQLRRFDELLVGASTETSSALRGGMLKTLQGTIGSGPLLQSAGVSQPAKGNRNESNHSSARKGPL